MRAFVLAGLASISLTALAVSAPEARAAPAGTGRVAAPGNGGEVARLVYRRRHVRRHGTMRRRMAQRYAGRRAGRRAAPSQAGNARDPEKPVGQQQQGQTTGGPRY